MSAGPDVAKGAAPRRPHRVGLVCLGGADVPVPTSAARLLLDDLAAATRAYERRSAMGEDALEVTEAGTLANADVLVVALANDEAAAISRLTPSPGTRVYALLTCEATELAEADATVGVLRAWCSEHGLVWSGALVVRDAHALPATWASPRLGWLRRPVSEAVDALVLALRTGSDTSIVHVGLSPVRRVWAKVLTTLFPSRG